MRWVRRFWAGEVQVRRSLGLGRFGCRPLCNEYMNVLKITQWADHTTTTRKAGRFWDGERESPGREEDPSAQWRRDTVELVLDEVVQEQFL